ncbi:MAG: aryl-sulfate sulfotransferase [Promethearchaeota archaeon]
MTLSWKSFFTKIHILLFLVLSLSIQPRASFTQIDTLFYTPSNDDSNSSDVIDDFLASIDITHHTSSAQEGLNLFQGRLSSEDGNRGNFLFILDMEGNIKYAVESKDRFKTPKFINSTTIMYMYAGDIELRNIETNVTETLPIPEGHHDIEYNPFTDTFLTLQHRKFGTYSFEGQSYPIWYDDIIEYDRQGNQLWFWNCSKNLPFKEEHFLNEFWGGGVDWTHANTLFWLVNEDIIFYNPRNLDTFYKIDKQSGEIISSVGKLGDFTLYDKYGRERTTLWWHSHALEMIGPNRYILFDNDNKNQTNPINHRSRLVEIVVEEENMTAREVWSWIAPEDYYCEPFGDADRLPNGNTLGTFGASFSTPTHLTEVTPEGKIAWEIKFDHLSEMRTSIYQSERFFKSPLIKIRDIINQTEKGGNLTVSISLWNTHRTRYPSEAKISIVSEKKTLAEESFNFLPHWQETSLIIEVPAINSSKNDLEVIVENSDGKTVRTNLSVTIEDTITTETAGFLVFSLQFMIIGILTILTNQKRSRKDY